MPGRTSTFLAVAIAALASGCGGGDDASTPAAAVRSFNDAVAAADGERACKHLDDAAQTELQQSTQGAARASCKKVIELLADFYDDATKRRLREAKVAASEQGDRGLARFRSPTGFGGPDREQTYELRRTGDEWKITSLGLSPADAGQLGP